MDIKNQTPTEIDTALSEFYAQRADLTMITQRPSGMRQQNSEIAEVEANGRTTYLTPFTSEQIEAADRAAFRAFEQIRDLNEIEIEPREAEFTARNWTRAFFVPNAGGHVHTSRSCGTCFPTTEFRWVTAHSGMDTDEIVENWGESACTVCHPAAPTNPRYSEPSRLAQANAAEKAAEKAQKEEAKAAKQAKQAKRQAMSFVVEELITLNFDSVNTREDAPQWWLDKRQARIVEAAKDAAQMIEAGELTEKDLTKKARAKWNREGYAGTFPGLGFDSLS